MCYIAPMLASSDIWGKKESIYWLTSACEVFVQAIKGVAKMGVKRSSLWLRSSQSCHPDKAEQAEVLNRKIGDFFVLYSTDACIEGLLVKTVDIVLSVIQVTV